MRYIKEFKYQLFILLILVFGYISIPPLYSFQNDSLVKFLQAYSLVNSSFESQEYYYFFKDIDPNYTYFFTRNSIYFLEANGLHIGPFPILFSYITSFYFLFPFYFFSLFSGFIFIIILYILDKYWKLEKLTLLMGGIGTSLLIYAFEYSENIYYILLLLLYLTVFFKSEKFLFLSSLFLGISIFLRLETVVIFLIFNLSIIFVSFRNSRTDKREVYKLIKFDLYFILVVSIFFIYNLIVYNNILGPRFIADRENFWNLHNKINNYLSLYFGNSITGAFKLGFFGLTPFFLICAFLIPKIFKELDQNSQILYTFFISYLIVVPAISPHDGYWSWGARYFIPILIPGLILSDILIKKFWGKLKMIFITLLVYSIVMNQVGIKIISLSAKSMKSIQLLISESNSDIRVFDSYVFALLTGTQLVDKPTLVLRNDEHLPDILNKLKNSRKGQSLSYFQSGLLEKIYSQAMIEKGVENQEILKALNQSLIKMEPKIYQQLEIIEYKYIIE